MNRQSIIGRRNFGVVWVCIAVLGLGHTARGSDIMAGVYYYPWYHNNNFHGPNPKGITTLIYHLNPQQTPELGWYDQTDSDISQHYQWARYAGIKFFVNSYWGAGSGEDHVLRVHMFDNPDRGNIKLAVFLEPVITPSNITAQTNYLCDNYFYRPGYFRIDGKPVIFIYITRAMSDTDLTNYITNLRTAATSKGYAVYIVGDEVWGNPNVPYETPRVNQMDAITNYDVYGNLGGVRFVTDSILNTWQSRNTSWKTLANDLGKQFIPAVSPGFNDRAVRDGHQPCSRKLNNESNAFGTLFSGMLDRADLTTDMNMIMVTSWNEWHEDTQIEPVAAAAPTNTDDGGGYYTDDLYYNGYGMLYLDILHIFTGTRTIYYVDANADPGGTGQTWGTAYKYLQDALYKPPLIGDEIWVAAGTYKPDANTANPNSGAREATFQLISGVGIYGGFAGYGAADPNARDIQLYETILSGDIGTVDVNSDNSYHVVTGSGTDANTVLDGFTITAGNANSSNPFNRGGGMYNDNGSPTVINCTFSGNSGEFSGGMYNGSSSPTLTNCTFTGNSAVRGGGMRNWNNSSPTLTNCTFSGNTASAYGGGMENHTASNPTLTNCTFSGNSADHGGGMHNETGSSPTVTNCTFSGNSADSLGGGMYNINISPTVTNCTFSGNSAIRGGGMRNYNNSSPELVNCTFSGNSANYGGGMENSMGANPTVANCIMWGDSAPSEAEIYNFNSTPTVTYSDIAGDYTGTGNIDEDPLFIDADGADGIIGTEDDNLRLKYSSPCIDAGDNNSVPADTADLDNDGNTVEPIPWDLDGRDRFADGDCNDTEIVDMGAYEFAWVYIGDFAGGCDVDFVDLAVLGLTWPLEEQEGGYDPNCDISLPADGVIDEKDLKIFTDNWLAGK